MSIESSPPQYLYNSTDSSEYRVESLYQVRRPAEDAAFGSDLLSSAKKSPKSNLNRKLHWHGTKAAHLLGILNSGLMINASGAMRTGRAYGEWNLIPFQASNQRVILHRLHFNPLLDDGHPFTIRSITLCSMLVPFTIQCIQF